MASSNPIEQAAARFIAQRETGPWSEHEAAELQSWLAQSTYHRVAYYRLNAAWQEAGRLRAVDRRELNADPVVGNPFALPARGEPAPSATLLTSVTEPGRPVAIAPRSFARRWPLSAAAAVLVLVAASTFVARGRLFHPNSYSTVVGGLEAIPMTDGSRITLNTDSALHISVSDNERRVDLDRGEAFFQVARDPKRPFVVHAGGRRIVAVGTQFAVRREGADIRVSVTEGAVRVESNEDVLLAAGSVAHSRAGATLVRHSPLPEIEQQLSWRSGLLTFHDTPLAEAVAEINRYNRRQISISDSRVGEYQVGGVFGATALDPFVRLLESGFPIRVTQDGDRIVLSAR